MNKMTMDIILRSTGEKTGEFILLNIVITNVQAIHKTRPPEYKTSPSY